MRVVAAMSGGVDSSVTAVLIHEAIERRFPAVFFQPRLDQAEKEIVQGEYDLKAG